MSDESVDKRTGEIVPLHGAEMAMSVAQPPAVVLEQARSAAKALQDVISKKTKPVMFNGEQYLEFEDWQTVGRFYGVTVKVVSTEFIDYGGVQGFQARAVVLDRNGMEISAADGMCLNDEEKWSSRPKYSYVYVLKDGTKQEAEPAKDQLVWVDNPNKPGKKMPQKERVKVGDEKVPLFQLRSMAQTRSCAKALRNVLAWVVVLAGYRPTPAEEMTGAEQTPAGAGVQQPGRQSNGDVKFMTAKFPSECPLCEGPIAKNDEIAYNSAKKTAAHKGCYDSWLKEQEAAGSPETPADANHK